MRVVKIYTGQLYKVNGRTDLGVIIDTTVKTGLRYLAPTWEALEEYKRSNQTPEDVLTYMDKYYDKMAHSFTYFQREIDQLLENETITLACYCYEGKFCHRHLLLYLLRDYALSKNIRVVYQGEVTKALPYRPPQQDMPHFYPSFLGGILRNAN